MYVNFIIKGRLGNAIFRYMAASIMCLYYNGIFSINNPGGLNCSDEMFLEIIENIKHNKLPILNSENINMNCFYQHDFIYKMNKDKIYEFIKEHPDHYILTDGINAGDGNCEKFYMIDIINTPITFIKKYKHDLHIRLEDFVTHNLFLNCERIIHLLNKNIIDNELCIVCKAPSTTFEHSYIKQIMDHAETLNIKIILEHNDILTDFYIMKEADILICSKSTLSWCAAFFSNVIQKCYFPEYNTTNNSSCKYPIDNTEFY